MTTETNNMKDNFEENEPGIKPIDNTKKLNEEKKETYIEINKKKTVPQKTTTKTSNETDNEKKVIKKSAKRNIVPGEPEQTAKKIPKKKIEAEPENVKKKSAETLAKKVLQLKKTGKKTTAMKKGELQKVKLNFFVRFHTKFGQTIYITGQHQILGNGEIDKALPMQYWNEGFWTATLELNNVDLSIEGIV